ncbi:MAG: hypothetical protein ACLRU1_07875 [Veillonella parvula]
MMFQPDVGGFKDIKLDGWDEVVKKKLRDGFLNLPEEKVSL